MKQENTGVLPCAFAEIRKPAAAALWHLSPEADHLSIDRNGNLGLW